MPPKETTLNPDPIQYIPSPITHYLAALLQTIYKQKCNIRPTSLTLFHSSILPEINIDAYFKRLAKYTRVSDETLVQTVFFLHLLNDIPKGETVPLIALCAGNLHRLLLTCMMVVAKFHDDQYFNNKHFAEIGGVGIKELNRLEVEFLILLNFELYISREEYQDYYKSLADTFLILYGPSNTWPPLKISEDPYIQHDFSKPIVPDRDEVELSLIQASCSSISSTASASTSADSSTRTSPSSYTSQSPSLLFSPRASKKSRAPYTEPTLRSAPSPQA